MDIRDVFTRLFANRFLRLVWDLNNCIVGFDDKSPEQFAMETVAKNLFGVYDEEAKTWRAFSDRKLFHPEGNHSSYYEYVSRMKLSKSKLQDTMSQFLLQNPPFRALYIAQLALATSREIFPSYFTAMQFFRPERVMYVTFGEDGPEVMKKLGSSYVAVRQVRSGPVAVMQMEGVADMSLKEFEKKMRTEVRPVLVRADYTAWNNSGKQASIGKELRGSKRLQTFIFDDNPCWAKAKYGHTFRINPLIAAADPMYFVQLVLAHVAKQM